MNFQLKANYALIVQDKNLSTVSILRYQIFLWVSSFVYVHVYLFNIDFRALCSRDIVF